MARRIIGLLACVICLVVSLSGIASTLAKGGTALWLLPLFLCFLLAAGFMFFVLARRGP
jgi:hypothetical protein